jgi:hypothetical protein
MRQQLNRSYKEVCAPMLEKCRFLLYEVSQIKKLKIHNLHFLHFQFIGSSSDQSRTARSEEALFTLQIASFQNNRSKAN